jgi:hypothetical protein
VLWARPWEMQCVVLVFGQGALNKENEFKAAYIRQMASKSVLFF